MKLEWFFKDLKNDLILASKQKKVDIFIFYKFKVKVKVNIIFLI